MICAFKNLKDCDFAPVLSVMDTMISVAHRECQSLMETVKQSEKSSHLVHLLCSLQTSLLVWCSSKIDPETGSDQTYSKESADSVQLLLSKCTIHLHIFVMIITIITFTYVLRFFADLFSVGISFLLFFLVLFSVGILFLSIFSCIVLCRYLISPVFPCIVLCRYFISSVCFLYCSL